MLHNITQAVVTYGSVASATVGAGLSAAGFSSSGIAAGSAAAAAQSSVGNVLAGSLFSSLQSFGAIGGPAGMILAGSAGFVMSLFLNSDSQED